jgi:acetyl-CoA carboxylase biotin carboxyl carrier protein
VKLTNEDVQEILRLLDASAVGELHVETEEFRLHLRRGGDGPWTQSTETVAKPKSAPAAPERAKAATAVQPTAAAAGRKLIDVLTPLPGTFYRSPQPGAPPFVEVGAEVDENTVVCIVETMKLMNSVHAGTRGRIAEICVDNDRPVAQNAVLMRIEPTKPGGPPSSAASK